MGNLAYTPSNVVSPAPTPGQIVIGQSPTTTGYCAPRYIRTFDFAGNFRDCKPCPEYQRDQDDQRYCAADFCKINEILSTDGSCIECLEGNIHDSTQRKCVKASEEECESNEI